MVSKMQLPFINKLCEECNFGTYEEPTNGQEWHVICNECSTIRMVYEPMPHQERFHKDPHKYRLFAGGYGSSKTTTACMEIVDHVLNTPGGVTLIGAATLPQLENTAQKEFLEVFPKDLIVSYSKQKNYLDTVTGHRVMFRPLDDEQKARSLNLSAFWLEEFNGVNYEYFVQLTTRLRHHATKNHIGIMSTNPDMNHVKTEFLLKADVIYNTDEVYIRNEINKDISVHIAPTHLNIHLPPNFYDDTARGRPEWWVRRYLEGSFENKEGLVYPQYSDNIVPYFDPPRHWRIRVGGDFGLNNPTGVVFLATDPKDGVTYVYRTHKEAQQPVNYHAKVINDELEKLPYGVVDNMVGDAAGQQKSASDMSSVFDHYAEHGIYWQPSTKKLEDSIMKNYSYFDLGKLKIMDNCTDLIDELSKYKYPERSLDKHEDNEAKFEKPIANNDHLLDALRYAIAELPDNPENLINLSYNAQHEINDRMLNRNKNMPDALKDNEPAYSRSDTWLAY